MPRRIRQCALIMKYLNYNCKYQRLNENTANGFFAAHEQKLF